MPDGSTDRKRYPKDYKSGEEMSDGFEERVCPKDASLFARMSAKAREVRLVFGFREDRAGIEGGVCDLRKLVFYV